MKTVKELKGIRYVRPDRPHIRKKDGEWIADGIGFISNIATKYRDNLIKAHCWAHDKNWGET